MTFTTECPKCYNTVDHKTKPTGLVKCRVCKEKYDANKKNEFAFSSDDEDERDEALSLYFNQVNMSKSEKGKAVKSNSKPTNSTSRAYNSDSDESIEQEKTAKKSQKPTKTTTRISDTDSDQDMDRLKQKTFKNRQTKYTSPDIESDHEPPQYVTARKRPRDDSTPKKHAKAKKPRIPEDQIKMPNILPDMSDFEEDEDEMNFTREMEQKRLKGDIPKEPKHTPAKTPRPKKPRVPEDQIKMPNILPDMSDFDEEEEEERFAQQLEAKRLKAERKRAETASIKEVMKQQKKANEEANRLKEESGRRQLVKQMAEERRSKLKKNQSAREESPSEQDSSDQDSGSDIEEIAGKTSFSLKKSELDEFRGIRWSTTQHAYVKSNKKITDTDLITRYRAYIDSAYKPDPVKPEATEPIKRFKKPESEYKRGPYKSHSKPSLKYNTFILYCSKHRPALQEKHPGMTVEELGKLLGQMWREMDPKEKENWKEYCASKREECKDQVHEPEIKRPPTAYILWSGEEGAKFRGQYGQGMEHETYSKFMSAKWKELPQVPLNVNVWRYMYTNVI